MKVVGVIPARYQSSRFPGKPLADLCGKPMIWWVYQQCRKVEEFDKVYVATDDRRIMDACTSLKMDVVLTSGKHPTGTDRVGEVAGKTAADLYVNIQGDEPLLEPGTIRAAITPFSLDAGLQVTNLMTRIKNPVDVVNPTVPKVVTNKDGIGVYLTRAAAPYPKGGLGFDYYKQVCVYGFRPDALRFYCDYGRKYGKAKAESVEDIEILRFIENGYRVQYVEVESDTVAVDTPNDLKRVRMIMERKDRGMEKEMERKRKNPGGGICNNRIVYFNSAAHARIRKGVA